MQDRMRRYLIIRCGYLNGNRLLFAWIHGNMPKCADICRISSENETVPATLDCCLLSRIGQGNYRFTSNESNPSTVRERSQVCPRTVWMEEPLRGKRVLTARKAHYANLHQIPPGEAHNSLRLCLPAAQRQILPFPPQQMLRTERLIASILGSTLSGYWLKWW